MILERRIAKARCVNKNDIFNDEISEHSLLQPELYYLLVDIRDEPISLNMLQSNDPNIRPTKGIYTLRYIPFGSAERNPKFPYLIGQDLVRMRVTVSGPIHWKRIGERIPELGWLDRNTTISKELFGIAKKHPGLIIYFSIKTVEYCDMIERKAKEKHIDIDHKPLVTYRYSRDVYEKYKDIKMSPIKTKQDYLDEIEEAKSGIESEE